MGEIIEGLLRLAQASRLKPRYEAFDLAELAREVPHQFFDFSTMCPSLCHWSDRVRTVA